MYDIYITHRASKTICYGSSAGKGNTSLPPNLVKSRGNVDNTSHEINNKKEKKILVEKHMHYKSSISIDYVPLVGPRDRYYKNTRVQHFLEK